MFFSIHTLGCKLNQLETEAITDAFRRNSFTAPENEPAAAGIIIVNTCTVTSMAEQKARRLIRKLLIEHPAACLIITGCYAQLNKDEIEKEFPERTFVLPGDKKDSLLDLPVFLNGGFLKGDFAKGMEQSSCRLGELIGSWVLENTKRPADSRDGSFRYRPEKFTSHSRGFLKIQDGCDRRCSYCRVSLARGKSRSIEADAALKELLALEERGFNEAVLTGVDITQYRDSGLDLAGLLELMLNGTNTIRLRLSSIDPGKDLDRFSEKFFEVLKNKRIRPHFHLSLQSGSDTILAKMGRAYSSADIEKTVETLRSVKEDPFLACDIIAAFPGESDAEFEKTHVLCERLDFAWIHAFPFSRRPGTAAYDFPDRVNERESKKRVELLTALARKGRARYIDRWKGREVEAIVESGRKPGGAFVPGVSENYLKLLIGYKEGPVPLPGSLLCCRITEEAPKDMHYDILAEEKSPF